MRSGFPDEDRYCVTSRLGGETRTLLAFNYFSIKTTAINRIYAYHRKRKYKVFIKIDISLKYEGLLIIFILDVNGTCNEFADSKMLDLPISLYLNCKTIV